MKLWTVLGWAQATLASEQCYSSRGCEAARAGTPSTDCSVFGVDGAERCLRALNASSGVDLVPLEEVMAKLEEVGQEQLHAAALRGDAWVERFARRHCRDDRVERVHFPKDSKGEAALRRRLEQLRTPSSASSASSWLRDVILVHSDELQDGIGARFKKAIELMGAALLLGFDGGVVNLPPAGGLLHPSSWTHGPVWCHESPADGPEEQTQNPDYPLRCWRFDLQKDFLAQSEEPEGRQLLWGYEYPELENSSKSFACFSFQGDLEGPPWRFLQRFPQTPPTLQRLFRSARRFAAAPRGGTARAPAAPCGYGDGGLRHVAMHVRRGDVGEKSGYALNQQLKADFPRWLCALARALAPADAARAPRGSRGTAPRLALHVFTEALGTGRGALRRRGLEGFRFEASPEDDEGPIFHTMAKLQNPTCDEVLPEVHIIVNNNPREALLCMASAEVLITSLSSLSWSAAVLNEGLVLHPTVGARSMQKVHWDLRDQYLDWAENWFPASDVWNHPERLRERFIARD